MVMVPWKKKHRVKIRNHTRVFVCRNRRRPIEPALNLDQPEADLGPAEGDLGVLEASMCPDRTGHMMRT